MDFGDTKLLIKVEQGSVSQWIHMCYVDTEVYKQFQERYPDSEDRVLNNFLSKWCKEDFSVELEMATTEDVSMLKELIKEQYRVKYPELYRDSKTDRQGWTRVWITSKMRKELEGDGKQSK